MIKHGPLVLLTLVIAAYPALIYFSLDWIDARWLILGLCALLVLRGVIAFRPGRQRALLFGSIAGMALLLGGGHRFISPLWYPVIVNTVFLALFLTSLWKPPSLIERLARLTDPELPPEGVAYTRKVTWVWSAFFLANGIVAAITVLSGDRALWALYNGLIAYFLMALLMAGEYWVRRKVKKSFGHA